MASWSYDITNAQNPDFVQYINNRDFSGSPAAGTAGDLAPEGLTFIPASQSPSGKNMLPWLTRSAAPPPSTRSMGRKDAADMTVITTVFRPQPMVDNRADIW